MNYTHRKPKITQGNILHYECQRQHLQVLQAAANLNTPHIFLPGMNSPVPGILEQSNRPIVKQIKYCL